jgi:hypothetical protein
VVQCKSGKQPTSPVRSPSERSFVVSILQLLVLAVAAMTLLATLRLVRVHFGRTPLPGGRGRLFLMLAFVLVPPLALGTLTQPADDVAQLRGVAWVSLYTIVLAGVVILMWVAALVVSLAPQSRARRLLVLALVGSEGDPYEVKDPPLTTRLTESMVLVDRTNAVFPRGPEFQVQVDRAGFRPDWDALDAATRVLESQIADDYRLGLGVGSAATVTSQDARGRLDTLRLFAMARGQAFPADSQAS